jgi:methyl-accepting chemotaxis protein
MLENIEDRKNHATKLFAVAVLASLLFLFIWHIGTAITQERRLMQNMTFYLEASHTMEKASDYLTSEARAFSVTQDVRHLKNFWVEVEAERRREGAVEVIVAFSGHGNLLSLLQESKMHSDALVETELTSMRLVLEAKHVKVDNMPTAVAEYTLPDSYKELDDAEKIKEAQKILFDNKYYESKAAIMAPLDVFRAVVEEDLAMQGQNYSHTISSLLLLSKALAVAVVVIAYHCARAVPLKAPAKPKARAKKK